MINKHLGNDVYALFEDNGEVMLHVRNEHTVKLFNFTGIVLTLDMCHKLSQFAKERERKDVEPK